MFRGAPIARISYVRGTGTRGLILLSYILLRSSKDLLSEGDRWRRFDSPVVSLDRGRSYLLPEEVCNDLLPERDRCRGFAMINYLRETGAGGLQ